MQWGVSGPLHCPRVTAGSKHTRQKERLVRLALTSEPSDLTLSMRIGKQVPSQFPESIYFALVSK